MTAELVRSGDAVTVLAADVPVPSGVVRKQLAGDPLWLRAGIAWRPNSPVAVVVPEIVRLAMPRYGTARAHPVGEESPAAREFGPPAF